MLFGRSRFRQLVQWIFLEQEYSVLSRAIIARPPSRPSRRRADEPAAGTQHNQYRIETRLYRQPRLRQSWSERRKLRIVGESLSRLRLGEASERPQGISGQRLLAQNNAATGSSPRWPRTASLRIGSRTPPLDAVAPRIASTASGSRMVLEAKNGRRVLIDVSR